MEGYNAMGYQLNKPALRAKMENACNDIAAGLRTKDDVVKDVISEMKTCFQVVQDDVAKLDTAMGRHFSAAIANTRTVNERFSTCKCGAMMALKEEVRTGGADVGRNAGQARNAKRVLECKDCMETLTLPNKVSSPAREREERGRQS